MLCGENIEVKKASSRQESNPRQTPTPTISSLRQDTLSIWNVWSCYILVIYLSLLGMSEVIYIYIYIYIYIKQIFNNCIWLRICPPKVYIYIGNHWTTCHPVRRQAYSLDILYRCYVELSNETDPFQAMLGLISGFTAVDATHCTLHCHTRIQPR